MDFGNEKGSKVDSNVLKCFSLHTDVTQLSTFSFQKNIVVTMSFYKQALENTSNIATFIRN